uniref:Uncharacterized protein n=1 Tax=Leersia perrieri TaxID=77586 RepID=A0A0D9VB21_9ORYZ
MAAMVGSEMEREEWTTAITSAGKMKKLVEKLVRERVDDLLAERVDELVGKHLREKKRAKGEEEEALDDGGGITKAKRAKKTDALHLQMVREGGGSSSSKERRRGKREKRRRGREAEASLHKEPEEKTVVAEVGSEEVNKTVLMSDAESEKTVAADAGKPKKKKKMKMMMLDKKAVRDALSLPHLPCNPLPDWMVAMAPEHVRNDETLLDAFSDDVYKQYFLKGYVELDQEITDEEEEEEKGKEGKGTESAETKSMSKENKTRWLRLNHQAAGDALGCCLPCLPYDPLPDWMVPKHVRADANLLNTYTEDVYKQYHLKGYLELEIDNVITDDDQEERKRKEAKEISRRDKRNATKKHHTDKAEASCGDKKVQMGSEDGKIFAKDAKKRRKKAKVQMRLGEGKPAVDAKKANLEAYKQSLANWYLTNPIPRLPDWVLDKMPEGFRAEENRVTAIADRIWEGKRRKYRRCLKAYQQHMEEQEPLTDDEKCFFFVSMIKYPELEYCRVYRAISLLPMI